MTRNPVAGIIAVALFTAFILINAQIASTSKDVEGIVAEVEKKIRDLDKPEQKEA